MDETQSGKTVFWVLVNDCAGEDWDIGGAFVAPESLSFDALYAIEKQWLAQHPYGKDEAFLDWLASEHGVTRVPVHIYPFR